MDNIARINKRQSKLRTELLLISEYRLNMDIAFKSAKISECSQFIKAKHILERLVHGKTNTNNLLRK